MNKTNLTRPGATNPKNVRKIFYVIDLTVSAVALDGRNDELNGCLRNLGLSDLSGWRKVFRGRAIFAVFTHQKWASWVREHDQEGRWRGWLSWIGDRYAI